MSFISVKNISKTFKVAKRKSEFKATLKSFFKREYIYVEAIKSISFEIEKGEVVGYIGPNGAGKSTTIKILSGILTPDSGECVVDGLIPYKNRQKYVANIGVVFGQRSQLWWDIPAEDTFDLLKDIYKIDNKKYLKTKEELVNLLDIRDIINIPVRQLSLGQRMRCEIAASLLHEPSILFLDEPTIGLDAISKRIVRDFIKKINKEKNVTVILTTHDMNDIEALAKRVILIGKGEVLYDGELSKLKNRYGTNKKVKVLTQTVIKPDLKEGVLEYQKIEGGYIFVIDSKIIDVSSFLNYITKKIDVIDIDVLNEEIEEVIIKLYKEYHL